MMRIFLTLLLLCLLPACGRISTADKVDTDPVILKNGTPVPGHFALYVDGSKLKDTYRLHNDKCYDNRFPVDARDGFRDSFIDAFSQVLQSVEIVKEPLSTADLAKHGVKAQIVVTADDMTASIKQVPGFWGFTVRSRVEYSAQVSVYNETGTVFRTTDSSEKSAVTEGDRKGKCAGASYAMVHIVDSALKDLVTTLTQRIAYADEMR